MHSVSLSILFKVLNYFVDKFSIFYLQNKKLSKEYQAHVGVTSLNILKIQIGSVSFVFLEIIITYNNKIQKDHRKNYHKNHLRPF